MQRRRYGAPRYMDWVAQIRAGGARVRIHFTGGALTVYGITPAEYSTTDRFIQKVIEQSSYFKDGRIVLLDKQDITDDKHRERSISKKKQRDMNQIPKKMLR